MKSYLKLLTLAALAGGLSSLSASADVTIDQANLLTNSSVQTSSPYSGAFNGSELTDGQPSAFIFTEANNDASPRVIFSGFDSAIDTLRLYDGNNGGFAGRASDQVTIYYSSSANDASSNPFVQTPANSLLLGTYTLNIDSSSSYYTENVSSDGYTYAELDNLAIPAGTQSLYLQFTPAQGQYGPGLSEVQAFAPADVPEPSVWALLVVAGGSMVLFQNRLRRQA